MVSPSGLSCALLAWMGVDSRATACNEQAANTGQLPAAAAAADRSISGPCELRSLNAAPLRCWAEWSVDLWLWVKLLFVPTLGILILTLFLLEESVAGQRRGAAAAAERRG